MPGGFPLGLDICNSTDQGSVAGTSVGTTITAGTANVKGGFTQLVAASAIDACWMLIAINNGAGNAISTAYDIAVGAGGSEKVIFSNLIFSANALGISYYSFPCSIPAGTRISCAMQSPTASDTCQVSVLLFDGSFTQMEGLAGADAIGFTSGTTRGSSVDAGATANTKGSYTQLIAATTRDYLGIVVSMDCLGSGTSTSGWGLLDIATGAAASEKLIVSNLPWERAPAPDQGVGPLAVAIPAGTRIAARAQCAGNTTPSRTIGVMLYGLFQ